MKLISILLACALVALTSAATVRVAQVDDKPSRSEQRQSADRIRKFLRGSGTSDSPNSLTPRSRKRPTIVGGYNATNTTVPYLAFVDVYLKEGIGGVCTGTVIGRDRVLTAAHCFLDEDYGLDNVESVLVWAGVSSLTDLDNETYPFYRAYTVHVDNRYSGDQLNWDLGIVTISSYFPDDYPVAQIAKKKLKNKQEVYAAGYGITDENAEQLPPIVQEVDLKARRFKKCFKFVDDQYKSSIVKRTMQCASAPKFKKGGKDTCLGDSGGPLFQKGENGTVTLYGVTSFGVGCARPSSGAWYVKLSFFYDMIMDHLALGDNATGADPSKWHLLLDDSQFA